MRLMIDISEEDYKRVSTIVDMGLGTNVDEAVQNGIPLEEIPNPCIECSQNCCVRELNGEKCECQKVYAAKESKE